VKDRIATSLIDPVDVTLIPPTFWSSNHSVFGALGCIVCPHGGSSVSIVFVSIFLFFWYFSVVFVVLVCKNEFYNVCFKCNPLCGLDTSWTEFDLRVIAQPRLDLLVAAGILASGLLLWL